jgi:hypothetical protein
MLNKLKFFAHQVVEDHSLMRLTVFRCSCIFCCCSKRYNSVIAVVPRVLFSASFAKIQLHTYKVLQCLVANHLLDIVFDFLFEINFPFLYLTKLVIDLM